MSQILTIAFIGLGAMGGPMAGHLLAAGHRVRVQNRTHAKALDWAAAHPGGSAWRTPAEAAEGADVVCTCVGNDDDLQSVILGHEGVLRMLRPGALIIDHTTASAAIARLVGAAALERGVGFLDAPVSGGQVGAQKGQLSIMVGGSEQDFARATPVLQAYGKNLVHMGPVGSGQLTKMVNQICIAGLLQGLSEALAFGQQAGLDMDKVLQAVSGGAASSWQMVNRGSTMVAGEFDFGFAVDWMRKDLGLCLDEARANGSLLPVTALVDQFYAELQRRGLGRMDTSSLITRLRGGDAEALARKDSSTP